MIYLLLPSLVWAFSYGLINTNLTTLDSNFVSFFRIACALLIFLPFLRPNKINLGLGIKLVFIGAIQYGIMYMSFLKSFQYLQAHQIILFTTITPFYVILINDLLDRKFNFYYLQVALIAVAGGAVIYYKNLDHNNLLTGALLVQVSDIAFAMGQVLYKRTMKRASGLYNKDVYALLFLGALMVTGYMCEVSGGWSSVDHISQSQLCVMLYLGCVASGLCFFMWNKGAVVTKTATLAVFNNIKSPLGILVSLAFFGESCDLTQLGIGMGLILLALYLAESKASTLTPKLSY